MRRWWVAPSAWVLSACTPPAASPVHEPNLTIPASERASAAPDSVASRASVAPRAPDDPAACIDRPPAESAWDVELRRRVDESLAKLDACTKGLPGPATMALTLEFERAGGGKFVASAASTPDACAKADCLNRGLARVRAPPVPESRIAFNRFNVALTPGRPPERTDAELVAGESTFCDGSGHKRTHPLPPEQIQAIVRGRYDRIRGCYERGLGRNPRLEGRVMVRFLIGPDGRVEVASVADNTVPDCNVAQCVRDEIRACTFPKPEGGSVTVVYPIMLEPG